MLDTKILVVDDDPNICDLLKMYLEKEGFNVRIAGDGGTALQEFAKAVPDLILLDVMLPVLDGWGVLTRVRETSRVPVIMLTAKGETFDKINGLNMGADDYVVKPFSSEELLLRIEAHLRRHKANLAYAKATQREGSNKTGNLEIFFNRYEVYLRGKKIDLTAKEFEILALLASNPGQAFTRGQIYEHIWGRNSNVDESSITVFMRKIREKIEDNPSQPKYLLTVWRVGYKFAERV